MPSTYRPNNDGFRAMAVGPEIRAALQAVAESGKGYAEGISQDFRDTGEYAASFEVRDATIEWQGEFSGPRAAAQLANTADHAAAVEWGNRGHKSHHVLRRTLDHLGGAG